MMNRTGFDSEAAIFVENYYTALLENPQKLLMRFYTDISSVSRISRNNVVATASILEEIGALITSMRRGEIELGSILVTGRVSRNGICNDVLVLCSGGDTPVGGSVGDPDPGIVILDFPPVSDKMPPAKAGKSYLNALSEGRGGGTPKKGPSSGSGDIWPPLGKAASAMKSSSGSGIVLLALHKFI